MYVFKVVGLWHLYKNIKQRSPTSKRWRRATTYSIGNMLLSLWLYVQIGIVCRFFKSITILIILGHYKMHHKKIFEEKSYNQKDKKKNSEKVINFKLSQSTKHQVWNSKGNGNGNGYIYDWFLSIQIPTEKLIYNLYQNDWYNVHNL